MKISPFTPLYFSRPGECGCIMSDWVITYSVSDRILIQVFHGIDEPVGNLILRNVCRGEQFPLSWSTIGINGCILLSFYELSDLDTGEYTLSFCDFVSNPFRITADKNELEETVLVQCSQTDNRTRVDMLPLINGNRYFFDFRFPGGFCDKDWNFKVENEYFTTDLSDIVETYAVDITEKSLTIGSSSGVPVWVGDMLNRMFSCDTVYVNGARYTRPDGATMEKTDTNVTGDRFVFSQLLRESHYRKAEIEYSERICVRRATDRLRSAANKFRRIKL